MRGANRASRVLLVHPRRHARCRRVVIVFATRPVYRGRRPRGGRGRPTARRAAPRGPLGGQGHAGQPNMPPCDDLGGVEEERGLAAAPVPPAFSERCLGSPFHLRLGTKPETSVASHSCATAPADNEREQQRGAAPDGRGRDRSRRGERRQRVGAGRINSLRRRMLSSRQGKSATAEPRPLAAAASRGPIATRGSLTQPRQVATAWRCRVTRSFVGRHTKNKAERERERGRERESARDAPA